MPQRLEPDLVERRDFLGLAGIWAAAVAILGSVLGMLRLPKPSVLPETGSRIRIGRPDEFPSGTTRAYPEHQVLVLSNPNGVAAISMECTHLGCVVAKTETGFSCPCHGSAFNADGEVVTGPAPRTLRWLEVGQTVDGRLIVDAKREVSPGTYLKV